MVKRQRGVTAIGWLFLLVPVALVLYAGIRLTPVYLNYMKVVRSMDQLVIDFRDDESATATSLRSSLERRLDIEAVDYPAVKDFMVRRDGQVWIVQAKYEDVTPLFSNLSLLLSFDKTVRVQ
jgi:hypothetical protein